MRREVAIVFSIIAAGATTMLLAIGGLYNPDSWMFAVSRFVFSLS